MKLLLPSRALLLAVGLGLHGPSCGDDGPGIGPGGACTRSSDCADDLSCVKGICASPDAGSAFGAHVEARAPDGSDVD